MKIYNDGAYIFPPRPLTKSPISGLKTYERMGFIAQPKLNGSCGVLFLNNDYTKLMGRHNNSFARETLKKEDLHKLHKSSGWLVLCGEYMNKSKKDSSEKTFSGFVIFDILVYEEKHLLGTTFQERQELLDTLYPTLYPHDDFIDYISPSVYRVRNIKFDFESKWSTITQTDMYEGFVLKRPDAILQHGMRENNNTGWQLKIRKSTKNYSY